jgi:hypothetical protein
MYVIMTGTPAAGFSVYLNEQGFPFPTFELGIEAAEDAQFEDDWWVVSAAAITDVDHPSIVHGRSAGTKTALERLCALAVEFGVTSDQLDQAIYDAEGSSRINNKGVAGQLEFLLKLNDAETVERIIRDVDTDGNYNIEPPAHP